MTFDELLAQAIEFLQRQGRVSYSAFKVRFELDDDHLEALKDEMIYARKVAFDEGGKVLVWTGVPNTAQVGPSPVREGVAEAERRQLTVVFCDLVESTALSSRLDPEDFRDVVRAYQEACTTVIARFDGHIAQYLGDGILIYFGYPEAHDDDARRAVDAALGIIEAMAAVNTHLAHLEGIRLAVRLGIHTGRVVVGEIGGAGRHERLALGETPNIAARLQSLAAPDWAVMSADTYRLVQGFLVCQDLGPHLLKGVATPTHVYRVLEDTGVQAVEVTGGRGLTPLVGRAQEIGLILERWAQVQEGLGQVVILSGDAGIGKSRLVQVLKKEHAVSGAYIRWELRCSPYHQHSAFFPVVDLWQRALGFGRDDTAETKLSKLETAFAQYRLALDETIPLFAALLSLPLPANRYPGMTLSPQRQKQKLLDALLAVTLETAAQQPLVFVVEDLHWVDPSTLELLDLLIAQGPTARVFTLLTCRPTFQPPWRIRAHITHLALHRLPRQDVERIIVQVAGGVTLPKDVIEHLGRASDGVPLFAEELTKAVLESNRAHGSDASAGSLTIPATLQDSLMARLDRLAAAKGVAQLGAALGRAFSYELIRAVSPLDEATLQSELGRLVDAELVYPRGVHPHTTYVFKHALIQEAAYQSLLRTTRQQYHRRTAEVLVERFPETTEAQPELLAHHYTEAGLSEQAVDYWQRAGQRALGRSANLEAISHLRRGLEVVEALDTDKRAQRELDLQVTLALALHANKGQAAPEVARAYERARELCRQVDDASQLSRVLIGLYRFYGGRMQTGISRDLVEQLFSLAQRDNDPDLMLEAHMARGTIMILRGELVPARNHLDQAIALYNPQEHRSHAFRYSLDPGVVSLSRMSWLLWLLGYPDQALRKSAETLTLAREVGHPHSRAMALGFAAMLHHFRREGPLTQELAETTLELATEQGLLQWAEVATFIRGWALVEQGSQVDGLAQMRQSLAAYRAMGAALDLPWYLAVLAEATELTGAGNGLPMLAEALSITNEPYFFDAEVHRLKGAFLMKQKASLQWPAEAEACFGVSLDIARRQHAKALELRAAVGMGRYWQQQGNRLKAHQVVSPVYGSFTEGFDTADLRDAKTLLDQLS